MEMSMRERSERAPAGSVEDYQSFESAMYLSMGASLQDRHDNPSSGMSDFNDDHLFHIFMDLDVMPPMDQHHMGTNSPDLAARGQGSGQGAGNHAAGSGGSARAEQSSRCEGDEEENDRGGERRGSVSRSGRSRRKAGRAREETDESSDEEGGPSIGGGRGGGKNKRVLANRQSAQRSRMRKLQFISDLENNVQALHDNISKMDPALQMLRQRHADLVSEHDEMRKHAVLLVQKCRQAESVNASLDRECSQIHSSLTSRGHGAGGYGYGEMSGNGGGYTCPSSGNGLQSVGSAPVRAYSGRSGGLAATIDASGEPCAYVSSAGVLQVSAAPIMMSSGQDMKPHHHMQHRPASAPQQQIGYGNNSHMYEGSAGSFSRMYMQTPEPVPY